MPRRILLAAAASLAVASFAHAAPTGFEPQRVALDAPSATGSPLALESTSALPAQAESPPAALMVGSPGARRAQMLLRSLTLPGWGQASMGHRTSATVFGIIETGVWATFASFRIQERLRKDEYQRTARLFAGIDLDGRDEEYRRIVGSYLSSEEYNRLVVYRDAANLHYDDPVAYRAYIAEHQVGGADAWAWNDFASFERYREERQDAQRSAKRAQAALIAGVANRLISAAHAARAARRLETVGARTWQLEIGPRRGDPASLAVGVRTDF